MSDRSEKRRNKKNRMAERIVPDDDIYEKIYTEFLGLRSAGLTRHDLIAYIELKNRKSEVNKMISFLKGARQLLMQSVQIKAIESVQSIQDFMTFLDQQLSTAGEELKMLKTVQEQAKASI